jgi:tRNA(Ile)-lysidine synthase
VRYWLSELDIQSPSMAVLRQLKPEVIDAAEDATPILQWQGWQFRRFNQQLFVIRAGIENIAFNKVWQQEKCIQLPNNLGDIIFEKMTDVQADKKSGLTVNPSFGPIVIRLGGYSVRFKPQGSQHSKPLKQWFKQWKVAPWLRESVLLVIQNEQVLGLFIEGCWQIAQTSDNNSENSPLWHISVKN